MNKKVFSWNGKRYYLLGRGKDRELYYLEEAKFECGWYWGIGYVEAFTNRRAPQYSKDIASHQHFDTMFLYKDRFAIDVFKDFFEEMVLDTNGQYKLWELMRSQYTVRKAMDLMHIGGSHVTDNPCAEILKDEAVYNKLDNMMRALMEETYLLLGKGESEVN